MASRKRNKGKERKAKKEETERNRVRNNWISWARGVDDNGRKIVHCDHGCAITIPNEPNHPIFRFMDELFGGWFDINIVVNSHSHLQLWNNGNYRKMAMDILISIGTNLMLKNDTNIALSTLVSAYVIPILENYNEKVGVDLVIFTRATASKQRDLLSGSSSQRRDVLKFYSKRISCSCLKEMYSNARKTLPKMGKCDHCKVENERVLLSVCSRCRIDQYCCRECQVAAWPAHQKDCDKYCLVHNRLKCEGIDQNMN